MSLERLSPREPLGLRRGEVVVCIPVHNAYEHFAPCLRSVLAHTPKGLPILIADDASSDPRIAELLAELAADDHLHHRVIHARHDENVGFPANVNSALAAADPGDLILLNSDCLVAEDWTRGLREAAYSDDRVATATPLTNHGTIVTVPDRGRPSSSLPDGWELDAAAAAVHAASLRIRPRLPTAIGHCMLIRRSAVELVGDFDLAFSPGYGEEVDFSQRCLRAGLSHVLADDVLVFHHGSGSFARDPAKAQLQAKHERLISLRYPFYHDAVRRAEADRTGPLPRALGAARRALRGLSAIVDGRILGGPMTGTQLQVLEVIGALARTGQVRLSVVVPDQPGDYAIRTLSRLPEVTVLSHRAALARGAVADVVHRPFQINHDGDLHFLSALGERLIITNQDLISYQNPSYFDSAKDWATYRGCTRRALSQADHVVFISRHALADALAEDLVDPSRATVIHNGVDHTLLPETVEPVPPRGAERIPPEASAILCLGTNFRHKNRLFALRLIDELQRRHGWPGRLMLAGPRVARGSSTREEAEFLNARPQLATAVVDFAAVTEAEKRWLYGRAMLVVYPTVHEGFGLIPFEAAAHGVPCLWAPGTALGEVLEGAEAGIVPWEVDSTAHQAIRLMQDPSASQAKVAQVNAAASGLTWDAAASALLELYERVCAAPARVPGLMAAADRTIGEDAFRLVGPRGLLPEEVHRPLLALASHRPLRSPVFGAMKVGYRISIRAKRWRTGRRRGR